jgi:hypothetical protein
MNKFFTPDYPKHIEAAQGIQGSQPSGGGWGRSSGRN